MSALPSPKEIGRRWFEEVWNQRRGDAIATLMAPHACGYLEGGLMVKGPAEFAAFHQQLLGTIPDLQITIERLIGEGDEVCIKWSGAGTHTGAGMGFAPTQQAIAFHGVTWLRVVNGQIEEGWDAWNQGALLAQLAGPQSANVASA
jgi:steroid delta-isomerase-like uncharacterized protein